jgi:hypothetical protein
MVRKIIVPMAIVVMATIGMLALSRLYAYLIVDLPTFIAVPVISCLYVIGSHGFKGFGRSFATACRQSPTQSEVRKAQGMFHTLKGALWGTGLLVLCISLLAVLRNLSDPALVGPNLAVCFLSILYAAFFNLLLIVPFEMALAQKDVDGVKS